MVPICPVPRVYTLSLHVSRGMDILFPPGSSCSFSFIFLSSPLLGSNIRSYWPLYFFYRYTVCIRSWWSGTNPQNMPSSIQCIYVFNIRCTLCFVFCAPFNELLYRAILAHNITYCIVSCWYPDIWMYCNGPWVCILTNYSHWCMY